MNPTPAKSSVKSSLSLGVALGGGGARGIAHIVILEALDELGGGSGVREIPKRGFRLARSVLAMACEAVAPDVVSKPGVHVVELAPEALRRDHHPDAHRKAALVDELRGRGSATVAHDDMFSICSDMEA
jgi:hypothetical protein